MKRLGLALILISVFFLRFGIGPVYAETVEQLQAKIAELQGQENSLSQRINIIDSQIKLTTLRIESIKDTINKLSTEIDELANEIVRLETMLTRRTELVLKRIPESYKRNSLPMFGVLLFSNNLSEVVNGMKYISTVQEQDAQLLLQLKLTQYNFGQKKDLRESIKKKQEDLKVQKEIESQNLAIQKKEKQILLEQTKNSEAVYQKLLAQALAERRALELAINDSIKVGSVNRGDPIALVGNTGYPGCSTGAHLHFEVRRGGSWVNAEDFLSGRDVEDSQNGGSRRIGNGSWDWPLEGSIEVTQRYGKTPYSWRYAYSGGVHTGIDMISKTSSIIRAPKEGTLYSSSQTCGGSSIIKIKYIEHGDNTVSFYLHVQ